MKYNSKLREEIKKIVMSSYNHPSAEDVYKIMLERNIKTSLSTIYRNLHQLSEDSEILELIMSDGIAHYDGNMDNHQHAYCISCKKIYDLMIDNTLINELIFEEIGMIIKSSHLLVKGICKDCEEKL